jgi:hypothetical protein
MKHSLSNLPLNSAIYSALLDKSVIYLDTIESTKLTEALSGGL